jgi:sirohydrochlorin cobaltochelatase
MKRYRHYTKDKAIILSVFGSVIEQQKYLDFKELIEKEFSDIDVFLSINSRMVLKDLIKKGFDYKNLAQTMADADMQGYKNIIVSSVNLFPACEHELLKKTIHGFQQFSFANIRLSNAILTKTKDTTLFLKELDNLVSKKNTANLYVIHGTPKLEFGGLASVTYSAKYLENKNENNYTCSLEGAFPYFAIKDELIKKMKKNDVKKVQIIPLLLVSGNHYIKDIVEIRDELSEHFKSKIVKSITEDKKFNLLEWKNTTNIIVNNIKEEIVKLGH